MLRHTGQKRTFNHNLRLAILLCLNAGFINGAGFLAFRVLTTNVTGHAALFAVNLAEADFRAAGIVALWFLLFLTGAFTSGICIEAIGREKSSAYLLPIGIIIAILATVTISCHSYNSSLHETEYFAGSLLFAMGMQNALVSMISGSVVRTTHLTGMFTDLGTDLSIAVIQPLKLTARIQRRILLRVVIITSFLFGGVMGTFLFLQYQFDAFLMPIFFLMTALFYDYFRFHVIRVMRRYK
ncbi:YoaK family protein [Pedobacter panaciterrae]|jgi:Predicted membrane protein|uniref:YoaK family protein n=1 Tax=Pedobacter panaciterrae TaxID=363849 RepID=A0ABU8NNL7_9SPHI|nr:YoaK family protein [Pedobacter panaciterrae]NQX53125.1 DUF1275 domain-containing protein [Pedobacter panaciterrae]